MRHFITQHWFALWMLSSFVFLLVWMAVHHESPEQRRVRRNRERAEATEIKLQRIRDVYVLRQQRKAFLKISEQGDDVLAQVAKEFNLDWYGHDNSTDGDPAPKRVA